MQQEKDVCKSFILKASKINISYIHTRKDPGIYGLQCTIFNTWHLRLLYSENRLLWVRDSCTQSPWLWQRARSQVRTTTLEYLKNKCTGSLQWDSLLGHLLCSQPQPLCSSCTQSAKICPDEALSWPESSNTPEHDQQGGESGSLDVSRKRWIRLMRNSIQSPSLIHYLQILTEAII